MVPRSQRPVSHSLIIVALASFLAGCAGQVPPPGGPVDVVAPQIIRSEPDTNAVHVNTRAISLEFSEYVDRRSVEESFFISPSVGSIDYEWSGREVTAEFQEPLHPLTTYIVTVGTDVKDRRAGNRMAESFTLAFSTGDSLDKGRIDGRVFDRKPEGVMIFAYKMSSRLADTLDPGRVKPDYITQTGKDGLFSLLHLAFDTYRLFAVRDEYKNLLYDRQVDEFGVTWGDFALGTQSPSARDAWFRLSAEDTTKPFVTNVRVQDRFRIFVRFSEPIDSLSVMTSGFSIHDTVTNAPVPIAIAYANPLLANTAGIVTAAPLDSPATYSLRIRDVRDLRGNVIDSSRPPETFEGALIPDTVRPSVRVRDMRDSVRGVAPDGQFEILFSDPPERDPLRSSVVLTADGGRQVASQLDAIGPADLVLRPDRPLASKEWYTIRVLMDSVRSVRDRGYRDSTFILRFETLDLRLTGNISGLVSDGRGGKEEGPVVVTAGSVEAGVPRVSSATLEKPGEFALSGLLEGKYIVSVYRDSDRSGFYSSGRPYPFVPAERFTMYPDTIRVRARWGVEGVNLKLP
jgi:hypothetical protein